MIILKNLSLWYDVRILIENASLQLYKGSRVGLVGQNGSGKTTLFKLLLGQKQADKGECLLQKDILISYIEQELENTAIILVEYVLASHNLYAPQYSDLPQYYQLRPNAEKLLLSLGFQTAELYEPLGNFSGGWQMRANLAKALFCHSDLLLLDEPTNHLDVETVIWLEMWLKSYRGLALIISHDREFLDSVTSDILHIHNKQLTLYGGNYTTFERTRAEKELQQAQNSARTQAKIAHIQSFVDRFKAKASKAKQAQSRMKMLDKLKFSATFNSSKDRTYSIEFFDPPYIADSLLKIENLTVGYNNKTLLKNVNFQLFTQDRVALLGKNGIGKTSFIKAIIDGSSLLSGEVNIHHKIKIAYFSQQTVETLDPTVSPFNFISHIDQTLKPQAIFDYLGKFGFAATIANIQTAKFSGGEKARLILAGIILQKPHILFLDEPTNHLDMTMREQLAVSLQEFAGAVILVSHDKFLLQTIVNDFYVLEHQKLRKFDGNLDDYHLYILKQESIPKNHKAIILTLEKRIAELTTKIAALSQSTEHKKRNKLQQELQSCEEKWITLQQ